MVADSKLSQLIRLSTVKIFYVVELFFDPPSPCMPVPFQSTPIAPRKCQVKHSRIEGGGAAISTQVGAYNGT